MLLSTKKYSHNLKVELFYLVGMFRTLSPGGSISVFLRNLLQGGRRGSQAIYKFATKGAGSLKSKISYQVKAFSVLCLGRRRPLGSLPSLLSRAPQPPSLFSRAPQPPGASPASLLTLLLASPSSSAVIARGGSIRWISVVGVLIHI